MVVVSYELFLWLVCVLSGAGFVGCGVLFVVFVGVVHIVGCVFMGGGGNGSGGVGDDDGSVTAVVGGGSNFVCVVVLAVFFICIILADL